MSRRRHAAALPLPSPVQTSLTAGAAALALVLTACGSPDPGPVAPVGPTTPASDSTAATAPPRVTSTVTGGTLQGSATMPPGSPTGTEVPPPPPGEEVSTPDYSQDPSALVVQQWAQEYARAASDSDPERPDFLALMTDDGAAAAREVLEPDLGWDFPGPLPLTVLSVTGEGDPTTVEACVLVSGYAADPATGEPGMVRRQRTLVFEVTMEDRVDAVFAGTTNCETVDVEGTPW